MRSFHPIQKLTASLQQNLTFLVFIGKLGKRIESVTIIQQYFLFALEQTWKLELNVGIFY